MTKIVIGYIDKCWFNISSLPLNYWMMKGEAADKITHRTTERYDLIADKLKTNVFFKIKSEVFIKIQSFVNLKKNQLKIRII